MARKKTGKTAKKKAESAKGRRSKSPKPKQNAAKTNMAPSCVTDAVQNTNKAYELRNDGGLERSLQTMLIEYLPPLLKDLLKTPPSRTMVTVCVFSFVLVIGALGYGTSLFLSSSANHVFTVGAVGAASYATKQLLTVTKKTKQNMGGWAVAEKAIFASFTIGLWSVAALHAGAVSIATLMQAGKFFASGYGGMTLSAPPTDDGTGGASRFDEYFGSK